MTIWRYEDAHGKETSHVSKAGDIPEAIVAQAVPRCADCIYMEFTSYLDVGTGVNHMNVICNNADVPELVVTDINLACTGRVLRKNEHPEDECNWCDRGKKPCAYRSEFFRKRASYEIKWGPLTDCPEYPDYDKDE